MHVWTEPLLRIAATRSAHSIPFGTLRTHGPVAGQRWDPHPTGAPQDHSARWGVLYTASTLLTACADTGQSSRTIDRRSGAPVVTTWTPTRALELLDLSPDSTWFVRHGASASLTGRPARHCQAWAHEIVATLGEQIDGLLVPSTWTGTNVVLFDRARQTIPAAPSARMAMDDPGLYPVLSRIASRIEFDIV